MYAFSFCLYGAPNPKYYQGLLRNIEQIHAHFPGWVIYVYTGSDVPSWFIELLVKAGVRVRPVKSTGPILMMHRFLAIDESDVDAMIVRDADSRVHHRDRFAIQEFIVSPYKAHAIRDHPYHTIELLGGLWGMKKSVDLFNMAPLVEPYLQTPWKFGDDQVFLRGIVYPKLKDTLLVHTSQTYRYSNEETHAPFPWAFTEACYCGKAEGNQTSALQRFFRR